jgi:hypothetical protein
LNIPTKSVVDGSARFFDYMKATPADEAPRVTFDRFYAAAELFGFHPEELRMLWLALEIMVLRPLNYDRNDWATISRWLTLGMLWGLFMAEEIES